MIDEAGLKKVAEGLDVLLSLQRKFQQEHGFGFWDSVPEKKRDMFVRTLFAAISELSEAGDEVNKWWKKGSSEPDALVSKREAILEEMIDALHFYLSALLILGANGSDVAESYRKKMGVNFDRQKDSALGYV